MSDQRLNDCIRCGEDACVISFDGKHVARVRRSSKCKRYRPNHTELSCQTGIFKSRAEAIEAWNESNTSAVAPSSPA